MTIYECPACGTLYAREPKRCDFRPHDGRRAACGISGDRMEEKEARYPDDNNLMYPTVPPAESKETSHG